MAAGSNASTAISQSREVSFAVGGDAARAGAAAPWIVVRRPTDRVCVPVSFPTRILKVRYDAGGALTEGVESGVGNGQGDSAGPVRSMIPLALVAKAVDALVAGYPYRTAPGARERRVPQVWFCDDGSFGTDDFEMLQTCFLVVSAVSRTLGLQIGVDAAGGKTAWSGAELGRSGGGSGTWSAARSGRWS